MTVQRYIQVYATEAITNFAWAVSPHPSYISDLAQSDYHLFGHLKRSLWGHHYANDKALQNAM